MQQVSLRKYSITMAGGRECQIEGDNIQITESGALVVGLRRGGFQNNPQPMQVRMAFAPGEWLRVHEIPNEETI
jgi:hypothetical protein